MAEAGSSGSSKVPRSAPASKRRSRRVSEEAGPAQEAFPLVSPEGVASQAAVNLPTIIGGPIPLDEVAVLDEGAISLAYPPDSRFLTRIGGARLSVTRGDGRPLDLPVDALDRIVSVNCSR